MPISRAVSQLGDDSVVGVGRIRNGLTEAATSQRTEGSRLP